MKQRLLYPLILLCLVNTSFAEESDWLLSMHAENMGNGHAASVAMQTGEYLYGGLSLNYIRSSEVIQSDNRKTIYPLFLFMGLQYPSKFSPFIEAGADLPEVIFDEIFDNEQNALDLTDYYLSGGVNISLSDSYSLSLYTKRYEFKYHETALTTTNKVREDSYGLGLAMRF